MESVTDDLTPALEIEKQKEEIKQLKSDLRTVKRELSHCNSTIAAMGNNFNIKMSMFKNLVDENKKQQTYLTHLLKNSADFLILTDYDLNIVYCSDSFLNKIGIKHFEEIANKNILDIYGAFCDDKLFEQLSKILSVAAEQNKTSRHDITADIDRCGKMRAYRITNTIMTGENVTGIIINWHDITDITNAITGALEASKAKSHFLAAMSHEIRTPMNAIIGISQIELSKDDLPEEYAMTLGKIYDSGNNLLGIINDILDMSKIENGKLEINPVNYDTPSLINDTVQLNIVRIGSNPIEFILDADENLPSKMLGDDLRIKQILNNLLSNAIKYTAAGSVKLSINHFFAENGDLMLRFRVSDTGQGLKPEDQKKLFSEYARFNFSANRKTEGAGIGLNITQNLVKMMDGKIIVESEYGVGSTFEVIIKQEKVDCPPIGKKIADKLREFRFSVKKNFVNLQISREIMPYGKILIVDDIESNLYVAKGLMLPYKLTIETALSGFKAIDSVNSGKIYDIIFMDHMMPEMDGIETTQKLRGQGYKGVIVALTANAITGNEEMFLKSGFDGFISKPIDIRRLNAVLNEFIRDKYPEEAKKYKNAENQQTTFELPSIDPKLLKIVCKDGQKAVTALRQTLANGDIKLFTTNAHAMKSALANVGEKEMSAAALALEDAGRKGDMEFIDKNAENFINSLLSLIEKLSPKEEEDGGIEISEDLSYLNEQILKVKVACENYDDTAAYAALDLLQEKQWKKETAKSLEEIRDSLFLHSDFDKAAELSGKFLVLSRKI